MSGTHETRSVISRTAVALVFAGAAVKGLSPFFEPDVWWHLRTGDRLRQTFDLVAPDPSAPLAAHDYTATQWLPEIVASAAYSVAGMGGVLWLRTLAILAMVLVVFLTARRYAGRLPSAVTAGIVLIGAGAGLNPRPQLVSFVLFAVALHAWLGMVTDGRPRWWLVPVFWVWGCSHGLWFFGLGLGAMFLAAIAIDPASRLPWPAWRRLLALWGACLVAVALTPLGPRLLLSPFQVAQNASLIADEWKATPLNNVFAWAALGQVALCVVVWAVRPRRRPLWQYALLGFSLFCVLWMWRLVPLGSIAAAPLVASVLQDLVGARRESFSRGERRTLAVAMAALLAVGAVVGATAGARAAAYPGSMQAFDHQLDQLPAGSVVLDDFGVSGWMLWAHPDLTPVADLRGEIYDTHYLLEYRDALKAQPGWQGFVHQTSPTVALLATDSPLSDALRGQGWTTVSANHDYVLMKRGAR
jgi:MFS family permease